MGCHSTKQPPAASYAKKPEAEISESKCDAAAPVLDEEPKQSGGAKSEPNEEPTQSGGIAPAAPAVDEVADKVASGTENQMGNATQGSDADVPTSTENPENEDQVDPMRKGLGDGPMRFHPISERTLSAQIDTLAKDERACFDELKARWNKKQNRGHEYSDKLILRFARCSPGLKKFNADASFKVMESFDPRYLSLTADSLESQLRSQTLFVLPEVQSIDGHDVFYMKPARYFPKKTSTAQIIDNLVYCMQTMAETKEKSDAEGIAFLANMDDWSFTNFSISYCHEFMMVLQGRIPLRVRMFLIVNPPWWFGRIWSIMKGMLSKDFQKKVAIIPESDLGTYLASDYKKLLPDEMKCGEANTDKMVNDYIAYRKYVESLSKSS